MSTNAADAVTIAELTEQLQIMAARLEKLEAERQVPHSVEEVPGDVDAPKSSRRTVLRNGAIALGATVAGVGLTADKAAAANGDNLIIGQTNIGTSVTTLTSSAIETIRANNQATSGVSDGTYGTTLAPLGAGVRGFHGASSGTGAGLAGNTNSSTGRGVHGVSFLTTGTAKGVEGESQSSSGVGVFGTNGADGGRGVQGDSTGTSGTGIGVAGFANSTNGFGVFGQNNANGEGTGVFGAGHWGVEGRTTQADGIGVLGRAFGAGGAGGVFTAADATGAAIATSGRVAVGPFGVADNRAPEAPLHVKQTGSADAVELCMLLESSVPPQQVFKNGTDEWFFAMTSDKQFKISKNGTGKVEAKFFDTGNMTLAGTLTQLSDENAKNNIVPVDPAQILDAVAQMPVSTWQYKSDPNVTHLGPTAQDFAKAFGLGDTDTGIATVDADGVALAAIKALHAEVVELRKLIEA